MGGSGSANAVYVAIDSSGNVFVTGYTTTASVTDAVPVTSGAYDESRNGSMDVYVAKFSSDLTSLSASTFLGGSGAELVYSMAIDSSDNVYVTGGSGQADDFPTTSGAYDESHNGSW